MYSIGNRVQILKLRLRNVTRKCDLYKREVNN